VSGREGAEGIDSLPGPRLRSGKVGLEDKDCGAWLGYLVGGEEVAGRALISQALATCAPGPKQTFDPECVKMCKSVGGNGGKGP
jgi:hypothetical protein